MTRIDCQGRPSKARQWSNLGPIKNDELWWDCFVIDCKCLPSKPVALVILFFWGKSCKRGCWLLGSFCQSRSESFTTFNCFLFFFYKYRLEFYHISGESQGDKDLSMSEQSKGNIFPQPIKKSTLGEGIPINLAADAKESEKWVPQNSQFSFGFENFADALCLCKTGFDTISPSRFGPVDLSSSSEFQLLHFLGRPPHGTSWQGRAAHARGGKL